RIYTAAEVLFGMHYAEAVTVDDQRRPVADLTRLSLVEPDEPGACEQPSQQRTSREGLANVGDKIVRMLAPDRHANQGRSNSDFPTGFLGEAGMYCRCGMAN